MSNSEKFLARWSRRKREALEAGEETQPPAPQAADAGVQTLTKARARVRTLPRPAWIRPSRCSILRSCRRSNSITAETDIRPFLAAGVPADLKRAALRRAWMTDPKIRDFVGLADYDWDYHAPGSMAGFGPLEMTDELRQLASRIVGGGAAEQADPPAPAPAAAADAQTSNESSKPLATTSLPEHDGEADIAQAKDEVVKIREGLQRETNPADQHQVFVAAQHNIVELEDLQTAAAPRRGRALPEMIGTLIASDY